MNRINKQVYAESICLKNVISEKSITRSCEKDKYGRGNL
jgi:hypothetical protein